ncbi:MAG: hypothetical protein KC422_16730 [Trueperaceae bacterium]|nr:hypothetical protein [Trueperaceae bacterium]
MLRRFILSSLIILLGFTFAQSGSARQVYINGEIISTEDVMALEAYYQVYIPDGAYWYDGISGLVGPQGGPAVGQIMPGLALGGQLSPNASGTGTGTFINGRELHWQEVQGLQQLLGRVDQGYFWMDAGGNIGYAGGGYLFNLFDVMRQASASPSYNRSIFGHELTGSVIGDGTTVGFIDGDLGITCGPDGGCTGW